jgi:hypothetical protein
MNIKMKVYIAGPMRGLPAFNFQKFFYWAERLEMKGHEPLNPAYYDVVRWTRTGKMFDEATDYEEVLKFDLDLITSTADAIFLLDGWSNSEGAQREHDLAVKLGLKVYTQDQIEAVGK